MNTALSERLSRFRDENGFRGKGPLSVALVITDHARQKGLPLASDKLKTVGGGQVLGLGAGAVQTILKRHGIDKILAKEGGRTSRNSLKNMEAYVTFLNELQESKMVDIDSIECFWVEQVKSFFAGKPFKVKIDNSRSLRWLVRDLLEQASQRQKANSGTQYAGAVAQHLVAAKLKYLLGDDAVPSEGFSTADEQLGRAGDFKLGDTAVHVSITQLKP